MWASHARQCPTNSRCIHTTHALTQGNFLFKLVVPWEKISSIQRTHFSKFMDNNFEIRKNKFFESQGQFSMMLV